MSFHLQEQQTTHFLLFSRQNFLYIYNILVAEGLTQVVFIYLTFVQLLQLEFLTRKLTNIEVFWDKTPCKWVYNDRYFRWKSLPRNVDKYLLVSEG
jgi:hypothetical protein